MRLERVKREFDRVAIDEMAEGRWQMTVCRRDEKILVPR